MSCVKKHAPKSMHFKTSKPTSGVLAARVVTAPRQKNDVQFSQESELAVNFFPNTEQENLSGVGAANERIIKDSEFLLQASLFLQTAEQQLSNIESSLKQPKFPRKTISLNIKNCEKREYAHNIVKAVLNGHDLKREEIFSVPARLLKDTSSKNAKPILEDKKEPANILYDHTDAKNEMKIKSLKKITNACKKTSAPLEKYQRLEFDICSDLNVDLSPPYKKSVPTCSISSQDNILANINAEKVIEKPVITEPLAKLREAVPCEIIRKKINIESSYALKSDDQACLGPKNTALINLLSDFPSYDEEKKEEEDVGLKTRSLTIQALPSINIKPELTQETFTQVNILPSKTQHKESSTNKNVSFIEILFDEKSKEKNAKSESSSKIHKYDNNERVKRKPYKSAKKKLQISEPLVSFSSESSSNSFSRLTHHQEPSVIRNQQQSFDREKLNDILNSVVEKLASYVEIPDEVLENVIDRLWVLGDYLEDVYMNSIEGYRQKVRLNFTSLWLHEIIRLIDNEMRNECRALNLTSGVSTIVQYIISEIQCSSAVSHQQCCILAEENGEIQFYCRHDSQIDCNRKSRKENRASAFLKSFSPSKITFSRPSFTTSKNSVDNTPHSISQNFDRRDTRSNAKSVESDRVPRIFLPISENEEVPKSVSKLSSNERKFKDPKKTQRLNSFVPEKLAPPIMKDTNLIREKTASNHTIKTNGKNNFMDADQRQKVIQKLGEEVQKMLSWHEQLRLPDRFDESVGSNHSVTHIEPSEVRAELPSNKSSSVSVTSNKKNLNREEMRNTKEETDIKQNLPETQSEANPGLDSVPSVMKSNPMDGIFSANSSDVAYEDDWEEDSNTSAKNENDRQPFTNVENQSGSSSVQQDASKFVLVGPKMDAQNESDAHVDIFTEGSKKFLIKIDKKDIVNSTNSNVSNTELSKSRASRETDTEQSVKKDSPNIQVEIDRFSNNLPVEKHSSKNASVDLVPGFETDIASDFSDREGSTVNTASDKARNSSSDVKKSCVDSEAETVKDLSLLNSEVVDSGSKFSMSLHFEENSFKENDSGIVRECSLHNSMIHNKNSDLIEQGIFQNIENCQDRTKNYDHQVSKNESTSENPSVSLKLSKSCHELAEKVIYLEQMKNDLLRMFVKPENDSLNKFSSSQSLPVLKRKVEEFSESTSTHGNFNISENDNGSDIFAAPIEKSFVNAKVNFQKIFSESKHENVNQCLIVSDARMKVNLNNESSPNDFQVYHSAPGNLSMIRSDFLSKSSVSLFNLKTELESSAEIIPKSYSLPSLFVKNLSGENEDKDKKIVLKENMRKSNNCPELPLPRETKRKENSAAKSFVELSCEILKHLKEESEILAQLDSASSVCELSDISEENVNGETSSVSGEFFRKKFCTDKDSSGQSELESDPINSAFTNSDFSPPDFEHLISELSENMRGSVDSSDNLSGNSVDELFSLISSERYKIDCSENLETSIKDVLLSDDTLGNFIVERF